MAGGDYSLRLDALEQRLIVLKAEVANQRIPKLAAEDEGTKILLEADNLQLQGDGRGRRRRLVQEINFLLDPPMEEVSALVSTTRAEPSCAGRSPAAVIDDLLSAAGHLLLEMQWLCRLTQEAIANQEDAYLFSIIPRLPDLEEVQLVRKLRSWASSPPPSHARECQRVVNTIDDLSKEVQAALDALSRPAESPAFCQKACAVYSDLLSCVDMEAGGTEVKESYLLLQRLQAERQEVKKDIASSCHPYMMQPQVIGMFDMATLQMLDASKWGTPVMLARCSMLFHRLQNCHLVMLSYSRALLAFLLLLIVCCAQAATTLQLAGALPSAVSCILPVILPAVRGLRSSIDVFAVASISTLAWKKGKSLAAGSPMMESQFTQAPPNKAMQIKSPTTGEVLNPETLKRQTSQSSEQNHSPQGHGSDVQESATKDATAAKDCLSVRTHWMAAVKAFDARARAEFRATAALASSRLRTMKLRPDHSTFSALNVDTLPSKPKSSPLASTCEGFSALRLFCMCLLDLPDFDEEENKKEEEKANGDAKKASAAGMHASGFKDFLLKPELLRAIVDCGFEHPSEVQHECIPQAILGTDVLCQAKSGMGKTAVFVLACLQQIDSSEKAVRTLVVCHTRELAYQIKQEFERFSKYFPAVKLAGSGWKLEKVGEMQQDSCPHILIGTPGRVLALVREKDLKLDKLQHFVLDECDKCLDKVVVRHWQDVQQIFMDSPKKKQVMMFSATMSAETRALCKKFMTDPHEIRVDEESKLTLHGLLQYYVKLTEKEKNRKLNDLLDALEFNQVVIFVKSVQRAIALDKLLVECNFPSISIHSGLQQDERIARYKQFKEFQKRILVATDLFGRGIDIERDAGLNQLSGDSIYSSLGAPRQASAMASVQAAEVNIVINYDMPDESDSYLHRVGRAGRFGTKGLALTFVATDEDQEVLKKVQERFEVNIGEMPGQIDDGSEKPTSRISRPLPEVPGFPFDKVPASTAQMLAVLSLEPGLGKASKSSKSAAKVRSAAPAPPKPWQSEAAKKAREASQASQASKPSTAGSSDFEPSSSGEAKPKQDEEAEARTPQTDLKKASDEDGKAQSKRSLSPAERSTSAASQEYAAISHRLRAKSSEEEITQDSTQERSFASPGSFSKTRWADVDSDDDQLLPKLGLLRLATAPQGESAELRSGEDEDEESSSSPAEAVEERQTTSSLHESGPNVVNFLLGQVRGSTARTRGDARCGESSNRKAEDRKDAVKADASSNDKKSASSDEDVKALSEANEEQVSPKTRWADVQSDDDQLLPSADDDTDKDDASEEAGEWQEVKRQTKPKVPKTLKPEGRRHLEERPRERRDDRRRKD
eukprot:s351_g37.t1